MNRARAISQDAAAQSSASYLPSVLAAFLGMCLLLGAGFAPIAALHNAAHDTRHAFAFPCH